MPTYTARAHRWKGALAGLVIALCAAAPGAPAQAAEICAGGSPWSGPIRADVTVCISDVTNAYVFASGFVLATTGGARVTACVLYTKVWHNNSLVTNSVRRGTGDCFPDTEGPWFGKTTGRPLRGTFVTAQTWLDVRFIQNGRTTTKRFASPRAAMTWWP